MSAKYSDSLVSVSAGRPCPICGKPSYSRGGIHPQCSLKQADEKTAVRLRAARKEAEILEADRKAEEMEPKLP